MKFYGDFYRFIVPFNYDYAIQNNLALMQYEYDSINHKSEVTNNWREISGIKENDIILLTQEQRIYAWRYAIKPRNRKNIESITLNFDEMMKNNFVIDGITYMSGGYNGIIYFNDCECFYVNLTEKMDEYNRCWGQRIDVDKWRINDDEIGIIANYLELRKQRCPVSKVGNKKRACEIIKELTGDIIEYSENGESNMEDYKKLLESNYNLILTGAPGTGKTYLSKQIAAKIIFNDDNKGYTEDLEENEDFKNQCQFVQFHPSYDYTDFVEGLRPIKDSNGNIRFERKDGVFKEFCKKALKNLIDSKKEVSELNKDTIIKNNLIQFIDEVSNIINEKGYFEIDGIDRKAAPLKEIELDNDSVYFAPQIKSRLDVLLSLDTITDFYKTFIKVFKLKNKWEYQDFINEFGYKGKHTYIHGFLKAFYEKYNSQIEEELKNNTNTVEKVQKKNFVFIIDEINRGEISKIFGELFFTIDPGYRGIKGKILTQYSNLIDEESEKYFYIPENVYIIGTMNDIDRSVESMDFAMRRRFAWKEIKAEDTQYMLNTMFDNNNEITAEDKQSFIEEAKKNG